MEATYNAEMPSWRLDRSSDSVLIVLQEIIARCSQRESGMFVCAIQREIVDEGKPFKNTSAARALVKAFRTAPTSQFANINSVMRSAIGGSYAWRKVYSFAFYHRGH